MNISRDEIQTYLLARLAELSADWDFDGDVGPGTLLFSGLGMESLDAVVLGVSVQEHYGQQMPFAELLSSLGQQRRDLSIGELVDFIHQNLQLSPTNTEAGLVS